MPTPITASVPAIRRQLPASSSRISAMSNMSAVPTGSAAARHTLEISSAGVVITTSSCANSYAG